MSIEIVRRFRHLKNVSIVDMQVLCVSIVMEFHDFFSVSS